MNLNVILDVPVTLDNMFKQQVGYLDWEFMIEEYEIEPTDPEPPKTGDDFDVWLWLSLMSISLCALVLLFLVRKQGDKKKQ